MSSSNHARPRIAAVVLAGGMSTRMGTNKLLAHVKGEPLIRRVVRSTEASRARPVVVVTGHDDESVRRALGDAECTIVYNPAFREGLSTSLRAGIGAVDDCDGAIILLGDMPIISSNLLDKMISAFDPADHRRSICVATFNGKRGNPVLFERRFFRDLAAVSGDVGARAIVTSESRSVCEVEAGDDGPLIDIDTPEDLERLRISHE